MMNSSIKYSLKFTTMIMASGVFATATFLNSALANDSLRLAAESAQGNAAMPNAALITGNANTVGGVSRQGLLLPGEVDVRELLPSSESDAPPPFGANLFAGGYESERVDGINGNYRIAVGDKISVWLWGAVTHSELLTVDTQGNIFIPNIGPIKVADTPASGLNELVTSHIKKIYTNNVSVYVNLLTATPVSVYISGSVIRPGQYAGMSSDSILYYLKRAGGVDSERGSYRHIQVLRNGQVSQEIDLYEFIQNGTMPEINFKDKDVILVKPQGPTVMVSGGVKNPFRFEFISDQAMGNAVTEIARPLASISHVGVVGNRSDGPFSVYLPIDNFKRFELQNGDKLFFNDDLHAQVYDIQISGSFLGPSYYTVNKRTQLHDLLNYIEIDPELSEFGSIYIQRKSVAEKQKQMLNDSLDRLERSIFTAPASSDGEAVIRAKEAEMVMLFTEKARQVEPLGKVIVSDDNRVANIQLEQGDIIVIPQKSDLIQVTGEVLMPQAVVFNENASLEDYVAWAGGFTERAEDERIAVVRINGLVEFDLKEPLQPGDHILVLPKVDTKWMQATKDITQIIYQIAVAANVAIK